MKEASNMKFNLNAEMIYLGALKNGRYQDIPMRVGRVTYMCDIVKDNHCVKFDLYKKVNKDRGSYSKYGAAADMHSVMVKPNAIIDRAFCENIAQIAAAQAVCRKFDDTLM